MLVDAVTFKKFYDHSIMQEVGVADIRVVSREHLALLKIHAMKNYQEHRFLKDFNDLL